MINVNVFITETYSQLIKSMLLPSFRTNHPDEEIKVCMPKVSTPPNIFGATESAIFKDLMMIRMTHYLEILKKSKNEKVLFLDADVIILRPFLEDLEKRLETKDILHQGGGILAFNSNDNTIQLFEDFVHKCIAIPPSDRQTGFPEFELQAALNNYFDPSSTARLPDEYGYLCEDSYLYHAMNGGNTSIEKNVILSSAKRVYDILQINKKKNNLIGSERFKSFKKNKRNFLFSHGFLELQRPGGMAMKWKPFLFDYEYSNMVDAAYFKVEDKKIYMSFGTNWENHPDVPQIDRISYVIDLYTNEVHSFNTDTLFF